MASASYGLGSPLLSGLSDCPEFLQALQCVFAQSRSQVMRMRGDCLLRYRYLRDSLAADEERLHEQMEPLVRGVMKGKNILLMRTMLNDAGLESEALCHRLVNGFEITGLLPCSGIFKPQFLPPVTSMQELWRSARWSQRAFHTAVKPAGSKVMNDFLDEESAAEVENGWLSGPLSPDEVRALHGPCWVMNRRFAIQQGSKHRLIDDFSEFLTNSTIGPQEKLQLGGVDEVLAFAKTIMAVQAGELKETKDRNGRTWKFDLHSEWSEVPFELRGRCLDLKAAYKQLAIRPADRHAAIIGAYSSKSAKPQLFQSVSLPFGATWAVMGFSWAARSIKSVVMRLLAIFVSNYFDDYPTLEDSGLAEHSLKCFEAMLDLLGWKVSSSEAKRKGF